MSRARHAPGCGHCPRVRLLGRDFQAWRAAWEAACEQVTAGYAAERELHVASCPPPTFKAYLLANVGAGWPMSGRQPMRVRLRP